MMSVKNKLRSVLANRLMSPNVRDLRRGGAELQRRARGLPHSVDAFLQLDDPYSYLLATVLPALVDDYDIVLDCHLTEALGDGFQPEPGMLAEYAVKDCARLAAELGIPFLDRGASPPTELRTSLTAAVTLGDLDILDALTLYWRGDSEAAQRFATSSDANSRGVIEASQQRLLKLGHYNSAMLHYASEWHWGIDRLHYLIERLDDLELRRGDSQASQLTALRQLHSYILPIKPPQAAAELPPLEAFVSLRSPYSVIALPHIYAIAEAFGLTVQIRLVLPMVMRGMQLPRQKMFYIGADTLREAQRANVPFGNFADPVGAGIERVYAVHRYARSEHREKEFLLAAGHAIWADAIDVATDRGLRAVVSRCGLFWPEVKAALSTDEWREEVEENRQQMVAAGSWGVPTLRLGEFVTWGQDRLWLLVRHLEDLCDTGDGIVV